MTDYTDPKVVDGLENSTDAIAARLSAIKLPREWSTTCFSPSTNRVQFANYARDKAGSVTIEDVKIEQRIGSDSRNAVVYEGDVKGRRVAVKCMPLVFGNSWDDEVRIAQLLSNRALQDLGKPFPIVVGSGKTIIELPPEFGNSLAAWQETARINAVKGGSNRRQSLRIMQAQKDRIDNVYARYLISELAASDLQSVRDPSMYRDQMECALRELHSAGYAHGDAHLGNFLLTPDDEVLIHDFGNAIENASEIQFADDFAKLDEALLLHTPPS